jgi:hypothetical protein
MNKFSTFLLAVLIFTSCKISGNDSDNIKICFSKYKKSISDRDGKSLLECVDVKTFSFYARSLNEAIKYDSLEIEKLSVFNKYMIFKIRQNISYDSILSLNARSLLQSLTDRGIESNFNMLRYELGDIRINGDTATVEKLMNGLPSNPDFIFVKEKGEWKICEFSLGQQKRYDAVLKQVIQESSLSENDYILKFIEKRSGKKLKEGIWRPLMAD